MKCFLTLLLAYTTSHKASKAVPKPNTFPFTPATSTLGKLINSSTRSLEENQIFEFQWGIKSYIIYINVFCKNAVANVPQANHYYCEIVLLGRIPTACITFSNFIQTMKSGKTLANLTRNAWFLCMVAMIFCPWNVLVYNLHF